MQCMEYSKLGLSNWSYFCPSGSVTFRGNEAGLHVPCMLSNLIVPVVYVSVDVFWQDLIIDAVYHSTGFLLPLWKPWAFCFWLNNLSFVGFLSEMPGPELCVVFFFVREYHDFLICFDAILELSARLQNTRAAHLLSDWKTPGKQSANLPTHSSRLKKFPQSIFVQEEGFQVQTALLLFTVNALCQLLWILTCLTCAQPSPTSKNWISREALKKLVRNPPIRNAHIYLCDSAGYQNELLFTNSQTDYILMV